MQPENKMVAAPSYVLPVTPEQAKGVGALAERYGVRFYNRPIPRKSERQREAEYATEFAEKRKIVEWIRSQIEELLSRQRLGELIDVDALRKLYEDEYQEDLYHSLKYGLEIFKGFLDLDMDKYGTAIEIGGGPGPFCQGVKGKDPKQEAVVMDIADSGVLRRNLEAKGIGYVVGSILENADVEKLVGIGKVSKEKPPFYVMSYFLDRVPNQKLALDNFARILAETGGDGLVTVCLPAHESEFVKFKHEDWLTTSGNDPVKDLEALTEYCRGRGLTIGEIGITTHAGTSVDGHERIPAYCFRVSSQKAGKHTMKEK